MLGISYPIIGAPMFLVSYEALTIAVSEAGGLGTFPLPNYRDKVDAAPELGSKKWLDIWSAGQSVAQAESIAPAGDIVIEMATSYKEACERLQVTLEKR